MKRACLVHDRANLLCLPFLGSLAVAGLLGWVATEAVTLAFLGYIVVDFLWIAVQPGAVPSLPSVILFHHATTFVLLLFPLRHPQLGTYTCWDGLVEINTLFLIARRQLRVGRQLFSWLYWITFFPLRMGLYPYLLYRFFSAMQPYARWELVMVCSCQGILCGFNIVFLYLSVINWQKRGQERRQGLEQRRSGSTVASCVATAAVIAKPSSLESRSRVSLQAKVL